MELHTQLNVLQTFFVVEGPYLIFKVILSVIRFSFVELVQKVIVEKIVAPEPFS